MDDRRSDRLSFSDSDSDALFDPPNTNNAPASKPRPKESAYTTAEAREAALRAELDTVRNVNRVIEGVVESLEKAKNNMDTVQRTVSNASTLLQTWTRILSQTEHNQRLILNPQWQGATQDLVDVQEEEAQRALAAERKAAEDAARRDAAARKAEEERRRAEAAATAKPSVRGRGRGGMRARGGSGSVGGTGHVGVGGQTGRGGLNRTASTGRAGSGIGRGLRGRGRGLS